jgi:argininosuccinate lyase
MVADPRIIGSRMLTAAAKGRMWSGRFGEPADASFDQFQRSFVFDRRLLPYELAVDHAWTRALEAAGILTAEESRRLLQVLDELAERVRTDSAWLERSPAEDVHHFVEMELIEKTGALGAKLHTGRSRNELVSADFRLFVMEASREARARLAQLVESLAGLAERHMDVPMPGQTHLQHAQPILFAHFLLAHAEAFLRDAVRLKAAAERADECPLGSGALAGCAFPIDRLAIARELGFARITANSLDAAGDRDFALDYLYALAVAAIHLSRLAEDFVLLASTEFGFLVLPDEFSTGSSLMPQKKNPDAWELVRGKAGGIVAALLGLLVTLKGLPSSYQRDLQQDKPPVFSAHDQMIEMLAVSAGAVAATGVNRARMREAASDPALLATEAADYLVSRGVPFREAHEIVGRIVAEAEKQDRRWTELPLETLGKFSAAFEPNWMKSITLEAALARRKVPGGTAPEMVRAALADCRARLEKISSALGRAPGEAGS